MLFNIFYRHTSTKGYTGSPSQFSQLQPYIIETDSGDGNLENVVQATQSLCPEQLNKHPHFLWEGLVLPLLLQHKLRTTHFKSTYFVYSIYIYAYRVSVAEDGWPRLAIDTFFICICLLPYLGASIYSGILQCVSVTFKDIKATLSSFLHMFPTNRRVHGMERRKLKPYKFDDLFMVVVWMPLCLIQDVR